MPKGGASRDAEHLLERDVEELADQPEELIVGRQIDRLVELQVCFHPKPIISARCHHLFEGSRDHFAMPPRSLAMLCARQGMLTICSIQTGGVVSVAKVLGISRISDQYRLHVATAADLPLIRRIGEPQLDYPFAGGRMMQNILRRRDMSSASARPLDFTNLTEARTGETLDARWRTRGPYGKLAEACEASDE
jgi:hypothetical protein